MQDFIEKTLELLLKCREQVQTLALFSDNELIDDISTQTLKYLLIDYYLADIVVRLAGRDRLPLILQAKDYLNEFFDTLVVYGLMSTADFQLKQRLSAGQFTKNREDKINQFKRKSELSQKVAFLSQAKLLNEDEEECHREYYLATIDLSILNALDLFSSILQEEQLLSLAKENSSLISSSPKEPKEFKPFVLVSKREQLQSSVFKPGYRLPTMTIDEYLEKEREQGNIISGGGKMPTEQIKKDPEAMTTEEQDEDARKARQEDEFRDKNPRGWGNRYNKS